MKMRIFARSLCSIILCALMFPLFCISASAEEAFNYSKYLSTGDYSIDGGRTHFAITTLDYDRFLGDAEEGYTDFDDAQLMLLDSNRTWVVKQNIKVYAPSVPGFFNAIPKGYQNKERTVKFVGPLNYEDTDQTKTTESPGREAKGSFKQSYYTAKYEQDDSMPYMNYHNNYSWELRYDIIGIDIYPVDTGKTAQEYIDSRFEHDMETYSNNPAYVNTEQEIAGVRTAVHILTEEEVDENYLPNMDYKIYPKISYTVRRVSQTENYFFLLPVKNLPNHYAEINFSLFHVYRYETPNDAAYQHAGVKECESEYRKLLTAVKNEALIEALGMTFDVEYGSIEYNPDFSGLTESGKTDVVVDTPAKEEAGEDSGTEIPAIIILGTLGAGAALAGAASGDGEGDKKKRSSFKMYINKNFGNRLKKGDKPQAVFARIAEVTPDGREIPRPDLTGQIRVWSSDDSLIVKDGGMVNGYKCAMASVYDTEDQPPEGKVSFFFEGEGGTFTQNVIFNITVPGIKFFQENLTLPAGILEEPEFLPFEVSEMGDKYEIELSYNGENYEIDLAECDDKNANVHYAVFMETNKEIYDAGVYTEGWLNVTVKNESQTLKGSIKVIRLGMGLCLSVNALNCYRVPKKESLGKEMKAMTPADFETSITEAAAYVLYYDEENHEVRQMAAFPNVTFAPLEGETDEKKKQIQSALDQIRITPKLLKVDGDFANYAFVCEGGFLDAPTRYFVKMTYSADVTIGAGETAKTAHYESAREILLRSQPYRFVAGVKDNHEIDKYDDQIREMLFGIQKVVFEHYLSQLFPLYNMIDRMTAGFDRNYGYDPYQVAKVVDVWERFQTGELKGIGSDVNTYGVADELEALAAATRSWDGWSGVVLRISLDVMTGGASEIVMVALDVNRAAMDYSKASGGKGTAYGYFKAMAVPLVFGVGIGVVAAVGRGASKAIGTAAKKLAPVKTAALMEKAAKVKSVAKEMASLAAADAKRAAGYVVSKIPQGAKTVGDKIGKAINSVVETVNKFDPKLGVPKATRAESVVKESVSKGKAAGDVLIAEAKTAPKTIREKCLDMAGNATNKEGEILYNELIAAKKALQANPTSGAAQIKYNQAIMEFKASHAAVEHANSVLPGEQLAMRAVLNEDIERTMASKIEQKFKNKIAEKYNIDPMTVRFDRATANKDLSTKFGRDIDWTPKVVTKEGGTKYISQATADELLEQAVRETVEETCGKEFAEQFAAKGGFARKLDQTACTIQHKDFFQGGLNTVQQVTDKTRMGEFMGAEKARSVADTLRYKGAHPYAEGARLEKEVLSGLSDVDADKLLKELEAYSKADAATAKTIKLSDNAKKLKEAYSLMEEGMYQPAKYNKLVVQKEGVSLGKGYTETLTNQDYVNARILDRGSGQALTGEMKQRSEAWVGDRITLSEARKACELNGNTLETAIGGVGDAFEKIDAKFGYKIESTKRMNDIKNTVADIGLGGGINTAMNGLGGNGQNSGK